MTITLTRSPAQAALDAQRPQPTPARSPLLSAREVQVVQAMADGLTNADIGARLGISEETVRSHARRIFRRLGVGDRAAAAVVSLRKGLIS